MSYWTVTSDGFEEWVEVESAREVPVAEWGVTGATLRQDGYTVLVADATGTVRARVTNPRAYSAGGAETWAWLRVQGRVITLHTDARGAAPVDPVWTTVGGMSGCGAGSQPARAPPAGSVSPEVATVQAGAAMSLTATVLNDPSGGGVTWTATCPAAPCGALLPSATASGTAATYTPPATLPSGVTITATAASDASKSSQATLIPVGHVTGYDVGMDYRSYGSTPFVTIYDPPAVLQAMRAQLQGMAHRGARRSSTPASGSSRIRTRATSARLGAPPST